MLQGLSAAMAAAAAGPTRPARSACAATPRGGCGAPHGGGGAEGAPRPTRATAPQGWAMTLHQTARARSSRSHAWRPRPRVAASHSIVRAGPRRRRPLVAPPAAAPFPRTRRPSPRATPTYSRLDEAREVVLRSATIVEARRRQLSRARREGEARERPAGCCGLMCVSAALFLRLLCRRTRAAPPPRGRRAAPPCVRAVTKIAGGLQLIRERARRASSQSPQRDGARAVSPAIRLLLARASAKSPKPGRSPAFSARRASSASSKPRNARAAAGARAHQHATERHTHAAACTAGGNLVTAATTSAQARALPSRV